MTTATIFVTMLLMGFSCSVGCGSVSSSFILGTQIGGKSSVRDCMKIIAVFSLGKVIAYGCMGLLSSIFGNMVLGYIEDFYPNSTVWLVRIITTLFGISIIYSGLKKKKVAEVDSGCGSSCSTCGGCPSKAVKPIEPPKFIKRGSYFFAGALYAMIPCSPMIAGLTYASTMNILSGTLLMAFFGMVNSLIPVLLYAPLLSKANDELGRAVPRIMKPLKVFGGGLLLYVGLFTAYV